MSSIGAAQVRILRSLTHRLNATTSASSTNILAATNYFTSDLRSCQGLLSAADDRLKAKDVPSDAAATVHSFKTRLSSLLQDKDRSLRHVAVVLIKAVIPIGGYEILSKNAASWTRLFLTLLNRPESAEFKQLLILTVATIFVSVQRYPTLRREITTPTLPSFIAACIAIVQPKGVYTSKKSVSFHSHLLKTVLQAFIRLLPNHPATFRPFVGQLRLLIGGIVAPTGYDPAHIAATVNGKTAALAGRLHALLVRCTPKNEAAEQWLHYVRLLERHIHLTADEVFRSIVEDGTQRFPRDAAAFAGRSSKPNEPPSNEVVDDLKLGRWQGLDAGVDRLRGLLGLLTAYVASSGPVGAAYRLPVDLVTGVARRMLAVFPGQSIKSFEAARADPEIGRDERELLFLRAEHIHVEALSLLLTLHRRLGVSGKAVASGLIDLLVFAFDERTQSTSLRIAIYAAMMSSIQSIGGSLGQEAVSQLSPIIKSACIDACPRDQVDAGAGGAAQYNRKDADAYFPSSENKTVVHAGGGLVMEAAMRLLQTLLAEVPADSFQSTIRAFIDQTAVLVREHSLMLASVLNTSGSASETRAFYSIMPFIAQEHAQLPLTESLIRPRMPGIPKRAQSFANEHEDIQAYEPEANQPISMELPEDSPEAGETRGQPSYATPKEVTSTQIPTQSGASQQEQSASFWPSVPKRTDEDPGHPISSRFPAVSAAPSSQNEPQMPHSPKRMHMPELPPVEEDDPKPRKRVKLATFQSATLPTSVSVITEDTAAGFTDSEAEVPEVQKLHNEAGDGGLKTSQNVEDESSSEGSEIPPIYLNTDDESEGGED